VPLWQENAEYQARLLHLAADLELIQAAFHEF